MIYRGGSSSPSNLKARPRDGGRVSFRSSLSNPIIARERPVFGITSEDKIDDMICVDTERLPSGSVEWDDVPPGHVSVVEVAADILKKAVVAKWKNGVFIAVTDL